MGVCTPEKSLVSFLSVITTALMTGWGGSKMMNLIKRIVLAVISFWVFFGFGSATAAVVQYELNIAEQMVNISGAKAPAMTINGGIPGPVLRFREGDTARITVHNKMKVETSIHWHGLLVPPAMDGVPNISFPPIDAGTSFVYEFPIRQSGTYWYHSHTSLQEQRGVYGAIVIAPRNPQIHTDREHVVLFSDWTDENPHTVLRTLKRGSEWYALEKGSGQSILGAARIGMLGKYLKRELQRMPPMDIADVAYDRFLANGKPESKLEAKPGETVRLRIVDGSATTYFYLEFAGGPMRIVSADGIDVVPFEQQRFLMGVAETYDVIIKVPARGAYEFRATAHDGSGQASVWIGAGNRQPALDIPKPNLYQGMDHFNFKHLLALTPPGVMSMSDARVKAGEFDKPGMMHMGEMGGMQEMQHGHDQSKMQMGAMDGMKKMPPVHDQPKMMMGARVHGSDKGASQKHGMAEMPQKQIPAAKGGMKDDREGSMKDGHAKMSMPESLPGNKKYGTDFGFLAADISASKNLAVDGVDPRRPWPPYAKLRSPKPTAFASDKPVREIRLSLDGDMERYVWMLNKKTLSESDTILIRQGEVTRFVMINRTMMHHPMHLHGHFFRVLNGQGDHAPLKHTVNVAPMSTTVIEFANNEVGDWFFHCHLLYHMKAGMARVLHYENFSIDPKVAALRPRLFKDVWYFWGEAEVLSNMTEGAVTVSSTRHILMAEWEVGWQGVDELDWEGIVSWGYYLNRFATIFIGGDYVNEIDESDKARAVIGFNYLLPLNIDTRTWIDSDGGVRVSLHKDFELTPRLTVVAEAQYDTHEQLEGNVGIKYALTRNFSIVTRWHSDYGFGGGLKILF